MAQGIEEDTVLVSMLPFGPWSRFRDRERHGEELVIAWLGWSSHCLHGFPRCFFGAFSCWNVALVREGVSDGLSWVGPDELSGLTGKSG